MSLLFLICAVLEDFKTVDFKGKHCIVKGDACPVGDVEIPSVDKDGKTIQGIGRSGFDGCSEITSVKLSDNITVINRLGFSDCTSIKAMEIPASVNDIDELAFLGCDGMVNFTYYGNSEFGMRIGLNSNTSVYVTTSYKYTKLGQHEITDFIGELSVAHKPAVRSGGSSGSLLTTFAIIAFVVAVGYLIVPWWCLCGYSSIAEV